MPFKFIKLPQVNFSIILLMIYCITACNSPQKENNEGFISRLHTPKEKDDWCYILGPTTLDKHWKDFKSIDWEKEYWEEDKSGNENVSFLEVMDTKNNTHFSVSTFPLNNNSFQYSIWIGSRSIYDKSGNEIEKGYVQCYLLDSNDPAKVKRLMDIFFTRNYKLFFDEILKLEYRFEIEDTYQNLN